MVKENNIEYMRKIVFEYIKDYSSKKALLITGEWGIGKTYSIKKILTDDSTKEHFSDNERPIMISLFGIDNIEMLDKALSMKNLSIDYNSKTEGKLDLLSGAINKTFNSLKKLDSTNILKNFDFNIDLSSIASFIKYDKSIIILDDLERCNIDLKELFGFINNLVENRDCRVIVIANREKIENKEYFENYKEKVFEIELEFKNNFDTVCSEIINHFSNGKNGIRSFLNNKIDLIRQIFDINNSKNFRILEFAIHVYGKIFEIIDDISIENISNNYSTEKLEEKKDYLKEDVLKYTIDAAIKIKTNYKYLYESNRESFIDEGGIQEYRYAIGQNKIYCNNEYYFVDKYIKTYFIDEHSIKEKFINIIKNHDSRMDFEENGPGKLSLFEVLEEDELKKVLKVLEENLSKNTNIDIDIYGMIIADLDRLVEEGYPLDVNKYYTLFEENIKKIKNDIENGKFNKKRILINVGIELENDKLKELYSSIANLNKIIERRRVSIDSILNKIDLSNEEIRYIELYKVYLSEHSSEDIVQKILKSSNMQIFNFICNLKKVFPVGDVQGNQAYVILKIENVYENDKETLEEIKYLLKKEIKKIDKKDTNIKIINISNLIKVIDAILEEYNKRI